MNAHALPIITRKGPVLNQNIVNVPSYNMLKQQQKTWRLTSDQHDMENVQEKINWMGPTHTKYTKHDI